MIEAALPQEFPTAPPDSELIDQHANLLTRLGRSPVGRWVAKAAFALTLAGGPVAAEVADAAPAYAADQVYSIQDGSWYIHPNSATIHSSVSGLASPGDSITAHCHQTGDTVDGDAEWDRITDNTNGLSGFIADKGTTTPVHEGQEYNQLNVLGIPVCGQENQADGNALQPTAPLQGSEAVPVPTNAYDRQRAVNWAIVNAMDQPPTDGSCTWFVSGGLAKTPEWTSDGYLGGTTHAWGQSLKNEQPLPGTIDAWNARKLQDYLLTTYSKSRLEPIDFSPANNDPQDAEVGDLVFYDWGEGEGISHVAIVTKVDLSGYLEVSDWSTQDDGTQSSPVTMRGVTYSAVHHEWLQKRYPNVRAYLLHIDTQES